MAVHETTCTGCGQTAQQSGVADLLKEKAPVHETICTDTQAEDSVCMHLSLIITVIRYMQCMLSWSDKTFAQDCQHLFTGKKHEENVM